MVVSNAKSETWFLLSVTLCRMGTGSVRVGRQEFHYFTTTCFLQYTISIPHILILH